MSEICVKHVHVAGHSPYDSLPGNVAHYCSISLNSTRPVTRDTCGWTSSAGGSWQGQCRRRRRCTLAKYLTRVSQGKEGRKSEKRGGETHPNHARTPQSVPLASLASDWLYGAMCAARRRASALLPNRASAPFPRCKQPHFSLSRRLGGGRV